MVSQVIIDDASNWGAATGYRSSNFETNYGFDSTVSAKAYRTNDAILKAIGGGSDWYASFVIQTVNCRL